MSWHFSRAMEVEFSAEYCLDGGQSVQLRSIHQPDKHSLTDKTTAVSSPSLYWTMSEHLTGDRGLDSWISFLRDSRVRIFPAEVRRGPESTGKEAGFGKRQNVSFAKWDRINCCWRTPQLSLLGGLTLFSGTWPRWGSMLGGECSALPMLAHDMSVRGGFALPAVTASCWKRGHGLTRNEANLRMKLSTVRRTARISKQLSWRWPRSTIEWMMGFPIQWTRSGDSAMPRFQTWLSLRGIRCVGSQMKQGNTPVQRRLFNNG